MTLAVSPPAACSQEKQTAKGLGSDSCRETGSSVTPAVAPASAGEAADPLEERRPREGRRQGPAPKEEQPQGGSLSSGVFPNAGLGVTGSSSGTRVTTGAAQRRSEMHWCHLPTAALALEPRAQLGQLGTALQEGTWEPGPVLLPPFPSGSCPLLASSLLSLFPC